MSSQPPRPPLPPLRYLFIVLCAFLCLRCLLSAQVISKPGAPPGPRTGLIVGQVVDGTTGAPIPEAIILINLPAYLPDLPTTPHGRVMADSDGRFFFADLPAGDYYLRASQDGYIWGEYGQRVARGEYQLLKLAESEKKVDVVLRIWKYASISGKVVDEAGEPVIGMTVRALAKNILAGRVQWGTTEVRSELAPSAVTDDRGMFRLSQVLPGTFVIVAPSTATTVPVSVLDGMNSTLSSQLFFSGVNEVTPIGNQNTLQVGNVALLTATGMVIPPAASASGRMQIYPTTFYSSALSARDATPITVGAGDERNDIAISLRPVSAARVSGRLVSPDGSTPPPMTIFLSGAAATDIIGRRPVNSALETAIAMSDAGGRFTILGVPPGEYVLRQANTFLNAIARQGLQPYLASQRVVVGDADITDLTVELRPALRFEGRFEFRNAAGPIPAPAQVLAGIMLEPPLDLSGQSAVETNRDTMTFASVVSAGQYFVRPFEIDGWFVHSVTMDGKDVTDRLVNLQSDTTSIVVTMTSRASKATGTVKDSRGTLSSTAVVLAFPADRAQWTGYGSNPRNLQSVTTTTTGVYTIPNLPAGDYFIVAVEPDDAVLWKDPKTLELLSARATRISVGASDSARTIDLTIQRIR